MILLAYPDDAVRFLLSAATSIRVVTEEETVDLHHVSLSAVGEQGLLGLVKTSTGRVLSLGEQGRV